MLVQYQGRTDSRSGRRSITRVDLTRVRSATRVAVIVDIERFVNRMPMDELYPDFSEFSWGDSSAATLATGFYILWDAYPGKMIHPAIMEAFAAQVMANQNAIAFDLEWEDINEWVYKGGLEAKQLAMGTNWGQAMEDVDE